MAQIQTLAASGKSVRTFGAPFLILALLCALYVILYIDRTNISAAAPLIKADFHLNNTQIGLVFSAFAIPLAAFQLIGGIFGDRLGPRLILSICCAIVGISTIWTGLAGGFASLVAARMLLGLGEGAANSTATRAISIWMSREKWGWAQGITHAFSLLGNAVAPPLMVALFAMITWQGSFIAVGAASLLWVPIWALYFRDDPESHSGITREEIRSLPEKNASSRPSLPWLKLFGTISRVTAVDFCYGWTWWLFLTWIPSFFLENYHLKLSNSALFTSGVLAAGMLGCMAGGLATDNILRRTGNLRLARCSVIAIGFFGAFAFIVPVALIHDLTIAAIALSGAAFFLQLIVAPIWAVPMDIAPRYAGTASGMMNFGFAMAGLISPLAFGYLVDLTGSWVAPFGASIALLFLGAILALRLRPDQSFEHQTH